MQPRTKTSNHIKNITRTALRLTWKIKILDNKSQNRKLDIVWQVLTFLTSELLGSVVHVIIRDTARRVSLEFTKSPGSICCARVSMYLRIATFTYKNKESHEEYRKMWHSVGRMKDNSFYLVTSYLQQYSERDCGFFVLDAESACKKFFCSKIHKVTNNWAEDSP